MAQDRDDARERDLPEGVIDADPPGGWEGVDDAEAAEQNAAAAPSADYVGAPEFVASVLTDAALQPDDPIEGEDAPRGANPGVRADSDTSGATGDAVDAGDPGQPGQAGSSGEEP